MSYVPASLASLGSYFRTVNVVNLGVVGDASHNAKGTSYHLGRDRLLSTAYSIKTVRDRNGLTDAASAIDIGRVAGSLGKLRSLSTWLVSQARWNAAGTSDIREIIYSADGRTVLRWDRERGYASAPRAGEADSSHLTHTHVSYYRDSQRRDKVALFKRYFATRPLPDTSTEPTEDDVVVVTIERLPAPRPFTSKVSKLRRFTATDELEPIEGTYSSAVDATVAIESDGVPHGSGFLRLSAGGSAGKYILASEVTLA